MVNGHSRKIGDVCTASKGGVTRNNTPSTQGKGKRPSTFYNIGNSCYYNALLQCMYYTGTLSDIETGRGPLSAALRSIEQLLSHEDTVTVSPRCVKKAMGSINQRFGTNYQEDASELFLTIIDTLSGELGSQCPISTSTRGYLTSFTQCQICLEAITMERQPFHLMQLSIQNNTSCLGDCWKSNFQDTNLTDARCQFCGVVGQRVQKQTIELPQTLVIHFKRFSFDTRATKLKTTVKAPLQDWKPVENGPPFRLVATIDHHGESIDRGHYTANCLLNRWWHFDDTNAQPVTSTSVSSKDNYLLFYVAQ